MIIVSPVLMQFRIYRTCGTRSQRRWFRLFSQKPHRLKIPDCICSQKEGKMSESDRTPSDYSMEEENRRLNEQQSQNQYNQNSSQSQYTQEQSQNGPQSQYAQGQSQNGPQSQYAQGQSQNGPQGQFYQGQYQNGPQNQYQQSQYNQGQYQNGPQNQYQQSQYNQGQYQNGPQNQYQQGQYYQGQYQNGPQNQYQQSQYNQGQYQYGPQGPYAAPGHKVVTIDKNLHVWVWCFLLGWLGVDRFIRGQIGLGVCKLLLSELTLGIWPLVDWIIAMVEAYGSSFGNDSNFVFIDGNYAK